ncbi:hypothetical protein FQA39_LY01497 [Lamprigera yunnana]|nr:hypothetical protein FQA39_LY01497 [Lamprigera yunnana]
MGCKAAVQALQKADFLKAKVTQKCDLLNDSEAWTNQQQLQTIYHQVLVLDLEYALDKKVEQELWTVGFKNHITALQDQVRDKKNPHRSESQALLSWCLEAASGFYLTLLQELCMAFDLDLPFRKKLNVYSQTKSWSCVEQLNPPQTSSCIYICQYCLVHLGDIARYRNQRKQAESFYKHAILLSPTSGQPYNQLGLLQTSQGDKLAAIFYYVRGIAVKNPFPATATNLANTLSLAIDKDEAITEVQTKLTVNEFIRMFIRVHGLLYSSTDLDQADFGVKSLNATLTPLVATQSFTEHKLIQITTINLYALKHTVGAGTLKTEELTADEIHVRKLVLDLLAGSLSAFLLPVYTLSQDSTLLDYYALPAIKLISYWLQDEPEVLKEMVFQSRLQIWPGLCKLLNNLQSYIKSFDYSSSVKTPLTEDRELQGFLPLVKAFRGLDFKLDEFEENVETEKFIRTRRLIDFGIWLTTYDVNNTKLIVVKINENQDTVFEPGCVQPDPTIKLLEEMKSFNVIETLQSEKIKVPEKRGGILKPQGSLEKSRKEQEAALKDSTSKISSNIGVNLVTKAESAKLKRVSQNVALQSIFKKMEENKQVKFDMGSIEKEKPIKLETKVTPPKPLQNPTSSYSNSLFQSNSSLFSQTPKLPIGNEVHPDYYKSTFQNFANVPFDRTSLQNTQFTKNEMPPNVTDLNQLSRNINFSLHPMQLYNSPPPLAPLPNVNQNFPGNNPVQRPHMNQQLPPLPYQNLNQFSQSQEFNAWKHEERPTSNWWPSSNSLTNNYPQRDFQISYPFSNTTPYMNNTMDFNQQPPQSSNMLNRPWGSTTSNIGSSQGMVGFDPSNQGLSLRQTMLKETRNLMPMDNLNENQEKAMQVPSTAQGYSLFNNSWAPSIPGQFRNNESSSDGLIQNLRQQSLFSRQAPLQQLLERQNQLKKGDS